MQRFSAAAQFESVGAGALEDADGSLEHAANAKVATAASAANRFAIIREMLLSTPLVRVLLNGEVATFGVSHSKSTLSLCDFANGTSDFF
jgi:hypothetical protein